MRAAALGLSTCFATPGSLRQLARERSQLGASAQESHSHHNPVSKVSLPMNTS